MLSFKNFLKESITSKTVNVKTVDGIDLEGIYHPNGDIVLAHTHGTASFYGNEAFEPDLLKFAKSKNFGFLSFNNRGAHIFSESGGAAHEKFSDSSKDIDAWISFLKNQGVSKIILSGHSLGTEKIAYYVRNNPSKNIVAALFLAPSDTIGNQLRYEKKIGKSFFDEANHLVNANRSNHLLSDKKAHAGVLPMSAEAYLDFYLPNKPLQDALPFRNKNIKKFNIPVFALIPNKDHYNITSTKNYYDNLTSAGVKSIITDTDHDFNNFDTYNTLKTLIDIF